MKKKALWMIILCFLLAGCGREITGDKPPDERGEYGQPENGDRTMMENGKMDMTEWEKALMTRIAVDKKAAENGILDEWEKGILMEVRAGMAYLGEKYPDAKLEIIGCEAATSVRPYNTYTVLEEGNEDHYYEMRISSGKNEEEYTILDDYYGEIIREDAQKKIMDIVNNAGLPCLKVKASFDAFLGKEYGTEISVSDVLTGVIEADNSFQVYLEEEKLDHGSYISNVQEVKTALQNAGITGYVTVIIGTEDSKESVYRESFSL